jgi:parallel beta-helix repeat protein
MRPRTAGAARRLALEPLEARLALATLFVATDGSDANDGTSAAPWRTLQHAANLVNPGDTIIVRAGNYTGFYLDRDGTPADRIAFQAESGVTINQRNATTPDGINLEGADFITIEGFNVVGMPRTGIRSVINHDVILRNNQLDQNGYWGILTGHSEDILIEGNVASRSGIEHGIYVSNSGDNPIIRNNIIWGNRANGIHMNGDLSQGGDGIISGALVEGNVIYDNGVGGGSGINCDGVQNSIIRNNLIYNTHASGISLYRIDGGGGSSGNLVVNNTVLVAADGRWVLNIQTGSTGNTVRNNILYSAHTFRGSISISSDSLPGFSSDYNVVMSRFTTNGGDSVLTLAAWRSATGHDMHSLVATADQLFTDPAAFDFHLAAGSPAVDAGTAQFAPLLDIEGTVRPTGNGIDIGADELGSGPPPTNVAPIDVQLSGGFIRENSAAGTIVGTVLAIDPNIGDTHTFSLVDDAGGRFAMSGNRLIVASGASLNYEAATGHAIIVRATDAGGLSLDKSLTINLQNVNEVVSFNVQRGAAQRSYIRYVDLIFESSAGINQLISEGRVRLTRFNLGGTSPVNVGLAGKLKINGNRITADFGTGGIGGNRNTSVGNGYYRFSVDADRDGSQETLRHFYRLLGDTNGDRVVNSVDQFNVNRAQGRKGTNLPADVNGDRLVNTTDRDTDRKQLGRRLASTLPLDD